MAARGPDSSKTRCAFTLVEVIVVVSVIMILIGLMLPHLAAARERARAAVSISNLRSIGQVLSHYNDANSERYPAGEVGRIYPITRGSGMSATFDSYFRFGRNWPLLVRDVAPWEEHFPTWFSPTRAYPNVGQPAIELFSYPLSHSVMARPGLWRLGAASDSTMLVPARVSDVAHPASKVLSWDRHMAYLLRPRRLEGASMLANPTPMLFIDGHVEERDPALAVEPVLNVMNPDGSENDMPLHNTPLGVLGRDYE